MRRSMLANLITQAPIKAAFELFKILPDDLVRKSVFERVIDG